MACQKDMMAQGKAYPRTCQECGIFGPCKKGHDPKWTSSNPIGNGPQLPASTRPPEHTEQPLPKDGQQVVMPVLKTAFDLMSGERWKLGIERYGKPLQTFNSRNCGRDAMEEWFDLGMYLEQSIMERSVLEAKLNTAIAAVREMLAMGGRDGPNKNALEGLLLYLTDDK